jgi:hypothetical protein
MSAATKFLKLRRRRSELGVPTEVIGRGRRNSIGTCGEDVFASLLPKVSSAEPKQDTPSGMGILQEKLAARWNTTSQARSSSLDTATATTLDGYLSNSDVSSATSMISSFSVDNSPSHTADTLELAPKRPDAPPIDKRYPAFKHRILKVAKEVPCEDRAPSLASNILGDISIDKAHKQERIMLPALVKDVDKLDFLLPETAAGA